MDFSTPFPVFADDDAETDTGAAITIIAGGPEFEHALAQFAAGHGLSGRETYSIQGLEIGIAPGQDATVEVVREDGSSDSFPVAVRIDQAAEVAIFGHGGILPMVLREALGPG